MSSRCSSTRPAAPTGSTASATSRSQLGWLRTAPSVEIFMRAFDAASANGLLVYRRTPVLELANGVLRCTIRRAEPMSGQEVETWVVEIRSTGPASITRGPIAPDPPPREVVSAAAQPGSRIDAAQLFAALQSIRGDADAELRGWLAAISAHEGASDEIASEAIRAIGPSRTAAEALRARWGSLPRERREALLDMAADHHGSAFRGRIER